MALIQLVEVWISAVSPDLGSLVAVAYKQLLWVEDIFRSMKPLLGTRPG